MTGSGEGQVFDSLQHATCCTDSLLVTELRQILRAFQAPLHTTNIPRQTDKYHEERRGGGAGRQLPGIPSTPAPDLMEAAVLELSDGPAAIAAGGRSREDCFVQSCRTNARQGTRTECCLTAVAALADTTHTVRSNDVHLLHG